MVVKVRARPDVKLKKRQKQLEEIPKLLQKEGYKCLTDLSSEYQDQTTELMLQHLDCPELTIYTTKWRNFKRGNGRCPSCILREKSLSLKHIKEELSKRGMKYVSGSYRNNMSKIVVRCCNKGHQFETTWSYFQQTAGCGICAKEKRDVFWAQLPENRNKLKEWCDENPSKVFTTQPERELLRWVQQYYPSAKKLRDGTYEIDVFIPEVKIGIEYNGLYHHQESTLDTRYGKGKGKKYHLDKTQHFKTKGIRIIHLFAHEWRDRQEQVKSFLLSAIGKNAHKIGARKCKVIWTGDKELIKQAHQLLNDYHIQGAKCGTKYAAIAHYKKQIVAVATFGKHHRNNKDWVLTRFCTKANHTIQGLLSKVTKLAHEKLGFDLLSWAHYRISDGNGYQNAGWIYEELLPPDYFYHKNEKVVSKQSRQKKAVNTPKGMTEKEHAKLDGLEPVYDCGKIRFRYKQ